MAMLRGTIRFWGKTCLEYIGLSLFAAIVMIIFVAVSRENVGDGWLSVLSIFPYYLLIAGIFLMIVLLVSYFQTYCSVLLSMGATRKMVIGGILTSLACFIFGIIAIMGMIWYFLQGDAAESGLSLLPLMTSGMFLAAAVTVLAATILLKWGKRGGFALLLLFLFLCIVAGCMMAYGQADHQLFYGWLQYAQSHPGIIIGAGVLVYLAVGAFTAVVNRKFEVRM